MLAHRIMAITLGYEDLNDHETLRNDPLLQMATNRGVDDDQPLASTPTLWRLEDRVGHRQQNASPGPSHSRHADLFKSCYLNSFFQLPRWYVNFLGSAYSNTVTHTLVKQTGSKESVPQVNA